MDQPTVERPRLLTAKPLEYSLVLLLIGVHLCSSVDKEISDQEGLFANDGHWLHVLVDSDHGEVTLDGELLRPGLHLLDQNLDPHAQ